MLFANNSRTEGRMEFGLFFLMQRDEAWSEQAVYDSGLKQMLAAEALGYTSVARSTARCFACAPSVTTWTTAGRSSARRTRLGMAFRSTAAPRATGGYSW